MPDCHYPISNVLKSRLGSAQFRRGVHDRSGRRSFFRSGLDRRYDFANAPTKRYRALGRFELAPPGDCHHLHHSFEAQSFPDPGKSMLVCMWFERLIVVAMIVRCIRLMQLVVSVV